MTITKKQLKGLVTTERAMEWFNTDEKWLYCEDVLDDIIGDDYNISPTTLEWAIEWLEEYLDMEYLRIQHKTHVQPLIQP